MVGFGYNQNMMLVIEWSVVVPYLSPLANSAFLRFEPLGKGTTGVDYAVSSGFSCVRPNFETPSPKNRTDLLTTTTKDSDGIVFGVETNRWCCGNIPEGLTMHNDSIKFGYT
jgi:hypothetical protein